MAQPYPYPHPHMQQAGPYGTTQAPGPFGMGMGTGIGIGMVQQASTNPTVRGYLNEHMLSVGMGMTESWAGNYGPVAAAFWNSLKMYFAVNNGYVLDKLKIVLFPFRKRGWGRSSAEEIQAESLGSAMHKFALPKHDTNAPDLYIPLMAFVTFILITGYAKGTSNTFTPEVLTSTTTACIAIQILEMLVIRFLFYLMQVSVPLLDLLAFSGYKYVPLCVNIATAVALGNTFYFLSLFYTATAMACFMLRTMAAAVPNSSTLGPPRHIVIGGVAAAQYVFLWWLGRQ